MFQYNCLFIEFSNSNIFRNFLLLLDDHGVECEKIVSNTPKGTSLTTLIHHF